MPKVITTPTKIKAEGVGEKIIEEYFGRVNSATEEISVARMKSPQGWAEPGQCPLFNEYTLVLKGKLQVETKNETIQISEGQAILTQKNEWVKYSTPFEGGAEYVAICLPAFSPETVNRDE